jgi:hypothetical protein
MKNNFYSLCAMVGFEMQVPNIVGPLEEGVEVFL